ncbi:unnamed protein product [Auanema sp. JU1783]|nr:unnamed protein product [Auanema sp. JU1783]
MIADRRNSLIEAVRGEQKSSLTKENNFSTPIKSSIQDRLSALSKSADCWQDRVKKDDDLSKLNPSSRRIPCARKPPRPLGVENKPPTNIKTSISSFDNPSKVGILLNIDKGLESFFPHHNNSSPDVSLNLDLDSVGKTEVLVTPRRPKPRSVHRGNLRINRLAEIDTTNICIAEDPRDSLPKISILKDDLSQDIAKSAKEGLQAIEDYSAAKDCLKHHDNASPYPNKMLIRVKGDKKVDVRLVAPVSSSIHSSGVFILVTPDRLLKYEGENSNILERTKAAQICIDIATRGDLCCSAKKVEVVTGTATAFLKLLDGGEIGEEPALPLEPFECTVARLNLVLRITDDYKLQSLIKGERVRCSLLQPNDALIFDFGSEIYVWTGRNARKTTGRYAAEYAQQLMKKSVPGSSELLGEDFKYERPDWVLYRRLVQGVQDILFSSKFYDWKSADAKFIGSPMTPINSKLYSPQSVKRNLREESRLLGDYVASLRHPPPITTLEDQDIGREMKDVVTENQQFFELRGEELLEIDNTTVLRSNSCYVIRWQYRIQVSGVRKLQTGEESEKETGRERVAFFYWLGKDTTSKQQGLCALKLSHMDRDKYPHIRVMQGMETSLFLQLFQGKLVIKTPSKVELAYFLVCGAIPQEGHAVQIDESQPLRAHAVYIEINQNIRLVAGCDCRENAVKTGLILANVIEDNHKTFSLSPSASTSISIQGDDKSLNWIFARGRLHCPRFFRIYETEVEELFCPQYHNELEFPIEQNRLSDTVIIDAGKHLWLWSERPPSNFTLHVVQQYWSKSNSQATVVIKGNEPSEFIALFSTWTSWEAVEQPVASPPRNLKEVVDERSKTFPLEALRKRTDLPEGIDLNSLEQYLTDEEFQKTFGMMLQEFHELPDWKQIRLRKEAGLF